MHVAQLRDYLGRLQTVWGVAEDTLHQMVVDHEGDVAAVLASLCDSQSNAISSASTHNTTTAGKRRRLNCLGFADPSSSAH